MPPDNRIGDRTALALVGLIGGVVAIFVMLHQLLVFRPEYLVTIRSINEHLARLDRAIGIDPPRDRDAAAAGAEARR